MTRDYSQNFIDISQNCSCTLTRMVTEKSVKRKLNYIIKIWNYYWNFSLNCLLRKIGTSDITAKTPNQNIDVHENALSFADILCRVCPACMATNEGGATPKNVPNAKGTSGTPITGAVRFINQFGKNGVTRRNII